jgi:hypothetical protein
MRHIGPSCGMLSRMDVCSSSVFQGGVASANHPVGSVVYETK